MIQLLTDPNAWMAFGMLTVLEIVLGIDNIIFISILVARLPLAQRQRARQLGLGFAMASRLALLFSLTWVMGLTDDLFTLVGHGLSGRDLVLLAGGLFLLWKASTELFNAVERHEPHGEEAGAARAVQASFVGTIAQIAVVDIVFSLDSVITAVGMVDRLAVMVAAVVASVGVMLVAAGPIGNFVDRHPSVKILALAFLIAIGITLVAEAFDAGIPKGYIYGAMAFALAVEALNLRARGRKTVAVRGDSPGDAQPSA